MARSPALHVHPNQTETFRIVDGTVGFRLGRRRLVATAGETVVVEPGTAHTFWNAGDGQARFLCEIRPALGFERLLETMFALARDGKTNRRGLPHPLRLAAIADHHGDDIQLPILPLPRSAIGREARRNRRMGTGRVWPHLQRPTAVRRTSDHPPRHRPAGKPAHHPPTKDSLMTNQEHGHTTTRRGLLGVATVGLGATIGGVVAAPVAAYMLAPATQQTTFSPSLPGPRQRLHLRNRFRADSCPIRR